MLIDIINGKPVICFEDLTVPEFQAVWESSPDKHVVQLKLLYIYHMVNPKSSYANLPQDKRRTSVFKAYVKGWKIYAVVTKAMATYEELVKTPSIRYLEGVEIQIDKLGEFLRDVTPTDKNISAVLKAITEGSNILGSHAALKERIEKELAAKKNIKKNIVPNIFEDEVEENDAAK